MAEDAADGSTPSPEESEMGAAVDAALADEVKRMRARFVQEIMGLDRGEGVGRTESGREDDTYRDLDPDRRDEPGERP